MTALLRRSALTLPRAPHHCQLAGAHSATPFSVEVTSSDGTVVFSDAKFLMDYRNRDAGRCKALAHQLKLKIAEAEAPPPALPISFLESHLPTKVEYEASLKLSEDRRLKAESDALAKKVTLLPLLTFPWPSLCSAIPW